MFTGDAEYTLDPMLTARDRLWADLGKERLKHVSMPDATHDPVIATWHEPERTDVLRELSVWLVKSW